MNNATINSATMNNATTNNATTNSFINNMRKLQWTVLQRTVFTSNMGMLQRTWRNTIGRCSTRTRMTSQAFPFWLERQSSLLSFVRFSYQF